MTNLTVDVSLAKPCVGGNEASPCEEPGDNTRLIEGVAMSLCDAHARQIDAEAAGAAWAEREADAAVEPLTDGWAASHHDALPLAPIDLGEEERREYAVHANNRARERWDELVAERNETDDENVLRARIIERAALTKQAYREWTRNAGTDLAVKTDRGVREAVDMVKDDDLLDVLRAYGASKELAQKLAEEWS